MDGFFPPLMEINPVLDISLGEIFLILVLTLILVGPDKIPKVAKTLGKILNTVRRLSDDFRYTLEESIREDETKKMKEDAEKRSAEYEQRKKEQVAKDGGDPEDGKLTGYPEAAGAPGDPEAEASEPSEDPEKK